MSVIANAFMALLQPEVLLAMIVGILGGMIIGILPGLGGTIAAALMMPLTYTLSPTAALVMLTTIYTSAVYGGSFTAILLHTPGTTASAATALDGYELTKQGKGLEAIGIATFGSICGGFFSGVMLLMIAPSLSKVALMFSSSEYFLIAIFGLTIIGSLVKDAPIKGLASGAFGLLISTVGMDAMTGQLRFTFGKAWLHSGITIVPTMIGLFAISQVLILAEDWAKANEKMFEDSDGNLNHGMVESMKRMVPSGKTMLQLLPNAIRSSIIGLLIGIMPGAGGDVACWVAYDSAKRVSKNPDEFGRGSIAGVCASEASNNAVTGGSFIPLFTLGVPGSSTAAVILGGMMIHGLIPGNSLFTDQADKVYPIMIGFMIANILMGIVGILIGPSLTRLAGVPISSLAPILIVLCMIGAYTANGNMYDVYIALAFGIIGYLMRRTGFTPTPIVLAVILGGMAENGFSQSLVMARGDVIGYYLSRPISCVLLVLTVVALLWPVFQWAKGKAKAAKV
ncbi:putative tricarboxylic transport membrane protein [Oscillibacter sp. PC13]|uniref:tripartite tricarboxylate transporter permease n=1 Tax=Oscillibacter sp. PC13 TaxID=1855299 RepID=UPI0008EEBFA1|nr:tripartite tricarboxylate transporter permease [Oscillibacter sp. PC13]SFP34463.1 putative tricarboxylic transport membrane protein [Oscillibacter sp. PC13]